MNNIIARIKQLIQDEPVAFGTAVLSLIQAIIALLIAFNVPLNDVQVQSIVALAGSLIGATVLVGAVTRSSVTPVKNPRNNDGEALITINNVVTE